MATQDVETWISEEKSIDWIYWKISKKYGFSRRFVDQALENFQKMAESQKLEEKKKSSIPDIKPSISD